MWQKARIVKVDPRDSDIPRGLVVWANGPPREMPCVDRFGNGETVVVYELNMRYPLDPSGYTGPAFMRATFLELLPEFADDVPLIPWEDWLKGEVIE